MFKKIGLSAVLLGGLVAFAAPRQARAQTGFGVYIGNGPAPVYTSPYPAYPDYYYDPYSYYNTYPAPVYTYPYATPYYGYGYGYGYGGHGHERHEFREHHEHRGFRGGEHHGGGEHHDRR